MANRRYATGTQTRDTDSVPSPTSRIRRTRALVVGAGAAGCVAAATLADFGFEVIVVEAGPDRDPTDRAAPVNSGDLFRVAMAVQHVTSVSARAGDGEPTRPYLRGIGIGGSGAINGLLLHRGTPEDYERWAALPGCAGWDSKELWPRLARRYQLGRTHTTSGPIDALVQAAFPVESARFAIDATGHRACSAALDLQRVRRSIAVHPNSPVQRVLMHSRRCVGVELASGETIEADLVVVSAGAIQSPLLLQRSGIERPGIGQNLHDHPAISVALPLEEPTPLDTPPTTVISHLMSAGGIAHMQILPLNRTGIDSAATRIGAVLVGVLEQYGRGALHTMPDGSVTLEFNQNTDERDRAALRIAAGLAHRVCAHYLAGDRGGRRIVEGVPDPSESPATIDAWVSSHRGEYLHAAGTCRMGSALDDLAVVDNTCQVIGSRGLFVVDASIFPSQPRANPYLATMAVAELAAERIANSSS